MVRESAAQYGMVDEGAVVGITTNPTIFAKAIGAGSGYEDQVRDLALRGTAMARPFVC
jgi:transaldolase